MKPTPSTVLFNLKPGLPEGRRQGILAEVASWPAIDQAGPFLPDSPVEALQRAYVVTVRPHADPAAVAERLNGLPEVESASAPVQRRLVA